MEDGRVSSFWLDLELGNLGAPVWSSLWVYSSVQLTLGFTLNVGGMLTRPVALSANLGD